MQRRSFLITLGSMAIGSGLTSCQGQDLPILRLLALKNSLPPQLLKEFTKSIVPAPRVELAPEGQFKEILIQLQEWYQTGQAEAKGLKVPFLPPAKSPEYIPDLVSIGDAWLPKAIQEKLIQPIEVKNLTNWGKLESRWHELAQRDDRGNISSTGKIWGVPYRWGTTVIIYRRDKLAAAKIPMPQDWSDLWNPQLRQRISLLDRSREIIGLTLKKLGHSYNHVDLSQISNLKSELEQLDRQVKYYSAETYLQPLVLGDTWVAVGWSSDVIDLIKKTPNLGAIIPRSGTAISADLWVQPTVKNKSGRADRSKLAQQWLDYCLQPKVSSQISIFTSGTAPLFTSMNPSEIPSDIRQDPLILPPKHILDKSDFIYPLSSTSQSQYDRLWQEVNRSKSH
jgi:putative spermidine/putrescine transport system substrate-binding protein